VRGIAPVLGAVQVWCSLWREVGAGICSAPLQYEASCSEWVPRHCRILLICGRHALQGGCPVRLDVAGMTEEDKYAWSVQCGARRVLLHHPREPPTATANCPGGHARHQRTATTMMLVQKAEL